MDWKPCEVCGSLTANVCPTQYPELCGECAQLLVWRPQDFERKVAGLIGIRSKRERAKAWFDKQADGRLADMWRRLDAAELRRELEVVCPTRSA